MHLLRATGRLAILLAALAALLVCAPTATLAQDSSSTECTDGIDNDNDGTVDGADEGCQSETDSPYSSITFVTVALPLVSLLGTVDSKGVVNVAKFSIRAKRGSNVDITCTGKRCPFKAIHRVMLTTSLRVKAMEVRLRPNLIVKVRIRRPGQLGKYVSYRVIHNKAPKRLDSCLDPDSGKVRGCFVG